jgi:uncharacterized membrane protein YhhN
MMVAGVLVMCVLVMLLVMLEARPKSRLAYGVVKTAAAALFCVVGFVVVKDVPGAENARPLFLAALALSFVGDVCLIPKGHKKVFLVGLGAFLLAHVMFIPAFFARGVDAVVAGVTAVVLVFPAVIVIRWLRPHVKGGMRAAVVAYVVVICAMLATAAGAVAEGLHTQDGVTPMVLVGAFTFWCSDIFVARHRFVRPGFINKLFGLPMYFMAQLALISGFS